MSGAVGEPVDGGECSVDALAQYAQFVMFLTLFPLPGAVVFVSVGLSLGSDSAPVVVVEFDLVAYSVGGGQLGDAYGPHPSVVLMVGDVTRGGFEPV